MRADACAVTSIVFADHYTPYSCTCSDQSITQDQIVAVIAHELGHWKCRHTPINFCIGQVILLVQFSLFAFIRASPALFRRVW
jgi:hypothetical protein